MATAGACKGLVDRASVPDTQALRVLRIERINIDLGSGKAVAGKTPAGAPEATRLVTGLEGATGSTIGPGGALYVTESAAGRISRVDPRTGAITTFASGLPKWCGFRNGAAPPNPC